MTNRAYFAIAMFHYTVATANRLPCGAGHGAGRSGLLNGGSNVLCRLMVSWRDLIMSHNGSHHLQVLLTIRCGKSQNGL